MKLLYVILLMVLSGCVERQIVGERVYLGEKKVEDFDISLGDPFAQYVIVPTNLTNAQGVFGAYAVVERTFSWGELK